ncbi:unnamed protein product, partial [Amoebophrya sp. A120]
PHRADAGKWLLLPGLFPEKSVRTPGLQPGLPGDLLRSEDKLVPAECLQQLRKWKRRGREHLLAARRRGLRLL